MKPVDLSKFRKSVTKSLGIDSGFNNPKFWLSSGNYALNYITTQNFYQFAPLGKVVMVAGQSGSGKSYILSGNLVKDAQEKGIFPIIVDTEDALDEDWLQRLGVDTSEEKLLKFRVNMIDDVAKLFSEFIKDYRETNAGKAYEDCPKILFVIDSIGMLNTTNAVENFNKGEFKADMGRKSQQLKALVAGFVRDIGIYPISICCSNHSYQSQDMYNPDDVISGGSGFIFASSIVVGMSKLKLKASDEERLADDGPTEQSNLKYTGIRSKLKVVKSRFSLPHLETTVQISHEKGLDPYSGLIDLLIDMKLLTKDGNRYAYVDINGEIHKRFRKEFDKPFLDLIMNDILKQNENKEHAAATNEE